jgi:hypothetical protein
MEQTARRVAGGGVGGGRLGSKTLLLIRLRGPALGSKRHAKSSCPRTQLCRKSPPAQTKRRVSVQDACVCV